MNGKRSTQDPWEPFWESTETGLHHLTAAAGGAAWECLLEAPAESGAQGPPCVAVLSDLCVCEDVERG